ncbi:MAG: virion core protein, T7 gp14 family [Polynucleobacter sp.]
MCIPAAVIGVATALMGGLQSVAQYQQQQAAADYQNQVAQAQYQSEMAAYQRNQQAYKDQIEANRAAADRGYQREQQKLIEKNAESQQRAQDILLEKLQAQGNVLASGRTGKSIQLLASDAEREYGRDLANLGTNLGYATMTYGMNVQDIYEDTKTANNVAASQRMLEPSAPIMTPGPSALGLVAGIGGAALGGYQTYSELKALNPKNKDSPPPKPAPTPKPKK